MSWSAGRRRLAAALLALSLVGAAGACGSDGDGDSASSSLPPTSTASSAPAPAQSNRQAWAACVNQVTALLLAVVDPTSGVDPEQIAREAGEDKPEIQVFRRLAPEVQQIAASEGAVRARIRANNLAVSECRTAFPA